MKNKYTLKDLEKRRGPLTVGQVLKSHRLCWEHNQSDLAKKIGITQPSISAIESGKIRPELKTVQRIAKKIGHSEAFLLELSLNETFRRLKLKFKVKVEGLK